MTDDGWDPDRFLLLDVDPDIVGTAAQRFRQSWTTAENKSRSHAPDCLARLADGTGAGAGLSAAGPDQAPQPMRGPRLVVSQVVGDRRES